MSISFRSLGFADGDNALYVVVNTGQSQHPLLFDCGEGCVSDLNKSEIQAIEHLCFSHFHMDHISGFDSFFRCNFNRGEGTVNVWGPEQTIDLMHHRFRGFSWNLHHKQPGEWHVHEISEGEVRAAKFVTCEAFNTPHPLSSSKLEGLCIVEPAYRIETRILNHGSIPSIAYKVIESDRSNVDVQRLHDLGLSPGPWLKVVTTRSIPDSEGVDINNEQHNLGDLREKLLITSQGDSIAYLTDFSLTGADRPGIVDWLRGTGTLVCEAQYRHSDIDLAKANFHSTTRQVGELARDSGVGELILQHVSRRYSEEEWCEMLGEAQAIFPNTRFPDHWNLQAASTQGN